MQKRVWKFSTQITWKQKGFNIKRDHKDSGEECFEITETVRRNHQNKIAKRKIQPVGSAPKWVLNCESTTATQ